MKTSNGLLRAVPRMLTWQDTTSLREAVRAGWVQQVQDCFDALLRESRRSDPVGTQELREAWAGLSSRAREHVLLAPETTSRLLPGRAAALPPAQTVAFLRRCVLAEQVRDGAGYDGREELTTARGDLVLGPGGRREATPQVPGLPVLDLHSPYSRAIDLTGRELLAARPREPLGPGQRDVVLDRLRGASELLAAVSPSVAQFVSRFTTVLVVQCEEDDERFSSGSHGWYVGRSVLTNVHREGLHVADVVDGLVHEAVHALLYMAEDQEPWVLDPAVLADGPVVVSPWTGNPLPLRPYLQACFVWFGLLHFWAQAVRAGAPEHARTRQLLLRAARGFQGPPLTRALQAVRPGLRPDLTQCLDDMQAGVLEAMGVAA